MHTGYVITPEGRVFVQIPDDNQWGFVIASDDQTWDGGFGIGEWTVIAPDDPRISAADRDRLGWLLTDARGED